MKKLTALLIACTAFVCAAVSCGDTNEKKNSSEKKSQTTTVAEEETTEEKTEEETEEKTEEKTEDETEAETEPAEEASDEVKEQVEKLVNDYADATNSKDVDSLLKCMLPDEVIDALTAQAEETGEDLWDLEEEITGIKEVGVENVMSLNSKAIEGATQYFALMAAIMGSETVEFEIEEGYSFDMTLVFDSNGEDLDMSSASCAVRFKDYGWKILPEVDGKTLGEDMF